jgi:hypothetical protein
MEIQDLKVDRKEVIKMASTLNSLDLSKKKVKVVAIKTVALVEQFLEAVEAIPKDKEADLDEKVAKYYNLLAGQLESDGDVDKEEKDAEDAEKEVCPVFKKEWDPENSDCASCKDSYPDDYTECQAACEAKTNKETKKATKKKSTVTKTALGHRAGTQAGDIDELILSEVLTVEEMAEKLDLTATRIKSHFYYLVKEKRAELTYAKNGKLTVKVLV